MAGGRAGRRRGSWTSVELEEQRQPGWARQPGRKSSPRRQGAGRGRAGRGEGARGGARARAAVGCGRLAGTCRPGPPPAVPSVLAAQVAGPAGPGLRAHRPRGWRRSRANSGTEGLRRGPGREGGRAPGRAGPLPPAAASTGAGRRPETGRSWPRGFGSCLRALSTRGRRFLPRRGSAWVTGSIAGPGGARLARSSVRRAPRPAPFPELDEKFSLSDARGSRAGRGAGSAPPDP